MNPTENTSPQDSAGLFSFTEAAAGRINAQLKERGGGVGLRVGVKEAGCNGWRYVMDYAEAVSAEDTVIEAFGAKVVIDAASLPLLQGTTLDFQKEGLNRMFRFQNPNAAASCGCGESFSLEEGT